MKSNPRINTYLIGSALIAALGGLLFGFDTAVISGAEGTLQTLWGLSDFWHGFTMTSALIGTIVGAVGAGKPADRLGRRTVLFWIGILYFVSAVGCGLAWDWYSFLFFRFLGGLGVGAASVVSPLYIAEISPAQSRGRLVALAQFNIVFGILLAFLSNYIINALQLGDVEWRWMFAVEATPAAAFCVLLFLTPRSPRWLVAQGRLDEARSVLERLGSDRGSVDQELSEIKASLDLTHHSLREPLLRRVYLRPIMLAVAIAAFNQLSGINAILYYSKRIFEMAGAGESSALLNSVGIGLTNLVFTMLALLVIDHFGRTRLMLVGSIGYIVSLSCVAWAFYTYAGEFDAALDASKQVAEARQGVAAAPADPQVEQALVAAETTFEEAAASTGVGGTTVLLGLVLFIASHAFGQGAVIWVFISEIFPNRVRARGQALGSFTHWFMAALISQTFPMIAEASGGHAFAFYAVMMVLQLLWVLLVMPETKGVPLEDIQKKLGIE